jgi:hypothetical protein
MEAAFDAYFRAADLDRDGRISGQEAVAFFKGSGLPQPVLAQVPPRSPIPRCFSTVLDLVGFALAAFGI